MTISYTVARRAPLLEGDRERQLIHDWQQKGDRHALEELMLSHARLVYHSVRKVNKTPSDTEELVSEGLLGLIKAANMFDLDQNVRFSTYARWWVRNSVTAANTRLYCVVDYPAHAKTAEGFVPPETGFAELENEQGEIFQSDDPTPEEHVIARSSRSMLREQIAEAMKTLGNLEREIVCSRNLQSHPPSVEELAKQLGISRARLRQEERRAMSKLKFALLSRGVSTIRVS